MTEEKPALALKTIPLAFWVSVIICAYFGYAAGGFAARPYAWYEIIVPHNANLWCAVFLFAGLPLLFHKKHKGNTAN